MYSKNILIIVIFLLQDMDLATSIHALLLENMGYFYIY